MGSAYILYPLPNSLNADDPQQGPIQQALYFSAVEQENTKLDSEITEHAVEVGANITDHVRTNPDEVTLQIYQSNEPIQDFPDGSLGAIVQGVSLPVPSANQNPGILSAALSGLGVNTSPPIPSSAQVLQFTRASSDLPSDLLQKLVSIKDNVILCQVITSKIAFTNMCLTSIVMPRDAKTGTGLRMSLVFKHLTLVSSQIVTAPKIPKAAKKVSDGIITLQEYTPPPQKQSLLKRLGNKFAPLSQQGGSFGGAGATGDF